MRRLAALLARVYHWQPSEIDALYWDEALEYAGLANEDERGFYRMMLDVVAASQSKDGYKQLRGELRSKPAKTYKPLSEDEAVRRLKNGV